MTEKQAIEALKRLSLCGTCTTGPCGDCERKQAKDTALASLEEIQQYRSIGTVEECWAAMERQTAKIPDTYGDGYDEDGNMIIDMYECPGCGETYEIECDHYKYCPNCGQAIDQSNLI